VRLHVTRTIDGTLHALRDFGARTIVRTRRLPIGTVLVFLVAAVWLAIGSWLNYIRPQEFDLKAYERYQEQVAACRALKTSESRYDCVAQSLISQDRTNFGKAMTVFLPPLLLILGHYVWMEVCANIREREHARHAEETARRQFSRFRRDMREERAAALAAKEHAGDAGPTRGAARPGPAAPLHDPMVANPDPPDHAPKRA
jgi:hypothetical protein